MAPNTASSVHGMGAALVTRPRPYWMSLTLAPLLAIVRFVMSEIRLRRDERLLMAMDDHQLADIGIGRSQIDDAVRSGRISTLRRERI
jgi:uncharacterized protein YjiS (DUF1127 family)